jgi:hypothetical protein
MTDLDKILGAVDAGLAAEARLKTWAEQHPAELAAAAADGTIAGWLLETIGRADLVPPRKRPEHMDDPGRAEAAP